MSCHVSRKKNTRLEYRIKKFSVLHEGRYNVDPLAIEIFRSLVCGSRDVSPGRSTSTGFLFQRAILASIVYFS